MHRVASLTVLALLWGSTALHAQPPASTLQAQPPTSATSTREQRRLHLLFTGDIFGRYAWPACQEPRPSNRADLSQLAAAVHRLSRAVSRQGDARPLVLHAGSLLRFDVMGPHVFGEEGPLAQTAAELIGSVGFDAASVGIHDFGATPTVLERYMRQMQRQRLPLLSSNVSCTYRKDFRCSLLGARSKGYLVLQRGGLRVGVFSVVRSDLSSRVLARSAGSLSASDPEAHARQLVRTLRKLPVDLVLMLAEVNVEGQTPQPVLRLVEALGEDAPDLVLAGNMYERRSDNYLFHLHRGSGPPILGTDRFGQHLVQAVLHLARQGQRWTVERVELHRHQVAAERATAADARRAQQLMRSLCRTLARPLGQAVLRQTMSREAFVRYLGNVMRRHTRTEIALLNDSALADTGFPLSGPLTLERLLRVVRTETTVGRFRLSGAKLVKLLEPHTKTDSELHVLGLEKRADDWWVNGRRLVEGYRYRVATTAFVARGGDGLLSLETTPFKDSGIPLRRAVATFFQQGGSARDGDPAVDLAADFPALEQRWLLYSGLDLGLFLSMVTVDNGPGGDRFPRPLLSRDSVTDLSTELKLYLGASTVDHVIELDALLQYGRAWTRPQGEQESTAAESKDLVQGNALYKSQLLRNRVGGGRWYVPDPYAELTLASELTADRTAPDADGVERSYHYLELGGTAGIGLTLHPHLFVKLGAAVRDELLTPTGAASDIDDDVGLYLGYTLRRLKLASNTRHPLELESRLDAYFTDLDAQLRRELTWSTKLTLQLVDWLALSVSHRLFVFTTRGEDVSTANDLLLGLNLLWDFRYQTF